MCVLFVKLNALTTDDNYFIGFVRSKAKISKHKTNNYFQIFFRHAAKSFVFYFAKYPFNPSFFSLNK